MRAKSTLLASALMISAAPALAQRPLPTDIELRAAYCIPVIQSDLKSLTDSRAQVQDTIARIGEIPPDMRQQLLQTLREFQDSLPKAISERNSVLNRLQLFLVPRVQYLDASALMGAASRANSDMQEWSSMTARCLRECARPSTDQAAATQTADCFNQCSAGELNNRIAACRNPTWLPF